MQRIAFCLAIAALLLQGQSCKPKSAEQNNDAQGDAVNWSTVTGEEIWQRVFQEYDNSGPKAALGLLETAMEKGVIDAVEGEQVRAGFLYDLGRLDEAFLALANYRIGADHPDLLRLRAEILWGMGRYDEAKRDYENLIEGAGSAVTPEVLFAISNLYDEMGLWDKAEQAADALRESGDAVAPFQLELQQALQSDDETRIISALENWKNAQGEDAIPGQVKKLVEASLTYLRGDKASSARACRNYFETGGFDLSIVMALLRADVETGDFESFQSDLRASLRQLGAEGWLDTPDGTWPQPAEHPLEVARLLDWAAAFELGRGNSGKARLFAERALACNPYDPDALQQLALVEICDGNLREGMDALERGRRAAAPSDVRIRVRMLQLARLNNPGENPPWSENEVAGELADILEYRLVQYPKAAVFVSAQAEYLAYRGEIEAAAERAQDACALPGATRDMRLRRAYYLARLGDVEGALAAVRNELAEGYPYMALVSVLMQEARARSDGNLLEFAEGLREVLDPQDLHREFLERSLESDAEPAATE